MAMPGPTSLKNMSLASDMLLGQGDMLATQVDATLEERRRLKQASGGLNPNSPGLSPAVASLLGLQGGM